MADPKTEAAATAAAIDLRARSADNAAVIAAHLVTAHVGLGTLDPTRADDAKLQAIAKTAVRLAMHLHLEAFKP